MFWSTSGAEARPTNRTYQIAKKPVILIVDDDDDNLLLLSYAMDELGYESVTGQSGTDAIRLAVQYQPCLILLDILLPDLNGISVLQKLRQQPRTSHVPVIAVTALVRKTDRAKLSNAGFSGYLAKPYMIDDLDTVVSQFVNANLGRGQGL